jgi:hypothetical protein
LRVGALHRFSGVGRARPPGRGHSAECSFHFRYHHLLKTFWGWGDKQLPDGTLIWTSPSGQTYITTPGSALLFPNLCAPTGDLPPIETPTNERCADRAATMPTRRRSRAQNHAAYIAAERRHNRTTRQARQHARETTSVGPAPPDSDDEPPPF